MKRPGILRGGLILASLAALLIGGMAGAQSGPKVGTGDVVADRQRLMKLNGASWADIQAKTKAGNIEAIAVNAETIALNAMHIPVLFPKGSLTDKSKAKPEIWQKWAEFESAAKNMQTQAEKLRDAAKAKDAAATEAIVKDFGRVACGTCHTPFRVPPPRS
jgi:cytochrome c556